MNSERVTDSGLKVVRVGQRYTAATAIIPSKDRLDLCQQAVASIREFVPFVVVLVVDTGDGETAKWAKEADCETLHLPGASFAKANNEAALLAAGRFLWLVNNDVIATEETRHLFDDLDERTIVGPRLLYPSGLVQSAGVGLDQDGNPYNLWSGAPQEHPDVMLGCWPLAVTFACVVVSKTLWWKLGGLDEQYVNSYEDVDFCLRAREQGYRVRYVPEAVAFHLEGQTAGRHEHDQASWQKFMLRWVADGRLHKVTGV